MLCTEGRAMATAYSYMRFSTPDQRKGDSIRRQTAFLDSFVERNGLRLDSSLRFVDAGVSGHKGLHRSSDKYVGGGSKVQRRGGRKCSAVGMKFTGRRCPL